MTVALGVCALLLAACSTVPDPRIQSARDYIREVTGDDLKAGGGLSVDVQRAVADGRYVRIEGTIASRFGEPVEGIRYTIRLIAPGTPPRVLDTVYEEVDTTLDPGEDKLLRLRIENTRAASAPGLFLLDASPVRLGGKDVPAPPGWK